MRSCRYQYSVRTSKLPRNSDGGVRNCFPLRACPGGSTTAKLSAAGLIECDESLCHHLTERCRCPNIALMETLLSATSVIADVPGSDTKQLTCKRIRVGGNRAGGSAQPLPGVVRPRQQLSLLHMAWRADTSPLTRFERLNARPVLEHPQTTTTIEKWLL